MHDLLPSQGRAWRDLHQLFAGLAESYGMEYVSTPVVERLQLFERSVGQMSDIVMGEMYSFIDKGDERLCLRPEATAAIVRMAIESGLGHQGVHRLYYDGPMFRRERPQKGRYRQFHQLGCEIIGDAGYWPELDLILLSRDLLDRLGIDSAQLLINSLGTREELAGYRQSLGAYFGEHESRLGEQDRQRLAANPLRILDSKDPALAGLIADAPSIESHLGEPSRTRFDALCGALGERGCPYTVQAKLVRGLEYYSHTVFEWIIPASEQAQNTVIAGGRYDELSLMLGAPRSMAACGFAAGVERLLALSARAAPAPWRVSLIADGDACAARMAGLAAALRARLAATFVCDFSPRKLAGKLKDGQHQSADVLLLMGERERAEGKALASFPSGRLQRGDPERILLEFGALEAWLEERLRARAS